MIFELYYSHWDDRCNILISHPLKTECEFNADVDSIIANQVDDFLKEVEEKGGYALAHHLVIFIADKLGEIGYSRAMIPCRPFSGSEIINDDFQGISNDTLNKITGFNKSITERKYSKS